MVEYAISSLIKDTKNPNFSELYDETGKIPLNIQMNDPDSVMKLIMSMHDVIYYKGKLYGPYLYYKQYMVLGSYGAYTPRWDSSKLHIKNVGYKILIVIDSSNNPKVSVSFVDNVLDAVIKTDENVISKLKKISGDQ